MQKNGELSVCILEDNEDLIYFYKDILAGEGFGITVARSLDEFKTLLQSKLPNLLLADYTLQDGCLLEWLKKERVQLLKELPTMFISANTSLEVLEACFQMGARDYIVKPFRRAELLAKVRHTVKNLEFSDHHRVLMGLTLTERKIFEILSNSPDSYVSRKELESEVWPEGEVGKKTLTVHLKNIRQKLEGSEFHIEYRLGKGWKLKNLPG